MGILKTLHACLLSYEELWFDHTIFEGPSWSWFSWIYNYLCNRYQSLLKLWVRIPLRWDVLYTTLYDKLCQWLAAGRWFSLGTAVSSTNKTDHQDITELLLKVALNTITLTLLFLKELFPLFHLEYFIKKIVHATSPTFYINGSLILPFFDFIKRWKM